MNGIFAAFAATGLYYVGFAVFKTAADRMKPLRGSAIPRMVLTVFASWRFLVGLALVLGGLALQIVALKSLALGVAVPIFVSGLVPLLLIAFALFGERLTVREWLSLALIAVAVLLIALSIGNPPPIKASHVDSWKLAAVVLPALAVPLLLIVAGDQRPDGRHARPIAGIAFGLASGFPVGTAELAVKGWSDSDAEGLAILETPYPYLTILAATLGFGIMLIGFQRCRVSIVATVMTISAKTYLLVVGTALYGEPWPEESNRVALRVGAIVLAGVAVLLFPRYERVRSAGDA